MKTYTFSLVSDLHIDINFNPIPVEQWHENVLVAGDTANSIGSSTKWLNKLRKKGKNVFAVDGNHEHYANANRGRSVEEAEAKFFGKQQHLLPQMVIDDDLAVVGCNGWYDPHAEPGLAEFWDGWMNDHIRINDDLIGMAEKHANYLDQAIEGLARKVIVVTHTAPFLECLVAGKDRPQRWASYFSEEEWDRSNHFYHNRFMADVMKKHADKILIACHGHTHVAKDQMLHGIRVVANPRGYTGENPEWKSKEITLEY